MVKFERLKERVSVYGDHVRQYFQEVKEDPLVFIGAALGASAVGAAGVAITKKITK